MKYKKLLFFILLPFFVFAQKQPKVGLVLSGGGAKGFAHIGIIRAIEEAGLQIDYIGGTSMGSVVGSLYAAGYNSYQIEAFVRKADFNALIQDKIPRREKTYFEKTYAEKHAFTLPLQKGNVNLPLGLSKGQNALNLLTEIFAPVDNITDFSKLPIPFYCIATDIESGEEIILEEGSLPLAVRASSSFPTLFNPVELNGKLLLDGGVVNNFPVNRMIEKGMDVIIGVDVQGNLLPRDELNSVTSILGQIINFQMYEDSDKQIELVDIHIEPNVKDYSVTSFNKMEEIINYGMKEGKKYLDTFKNLAQNQTNKEKPTQTALNTKKFLVDRIIINGNKKYSRNYILGKLQLVEGDSVSYKDISHKINTLTATNNFERIDYHLMKSYAGKKLSLIVKEQKINSFLRLGVHYDQIYETGVLISYDHRKLLFTNDEFSLDVVIGDNPRFTMEYFVDNGIIPSYGVLSRFNSFVADFKFNLNNVNKLRVDFADFSTSIFTQTTLDKKFALGFGLEHKKLRIKTETILTNGEDTFFDNSNYINTYGFLRLDTFNDKNFPTDGVFVDAGLKWYLLSDRDKGLDQLVADSQPFNVFSQVNGTISNALSVRKKLTFQYTIEGGYTIGDENSGVFDYLLGGYNQNFINNFRSFYGYEIGELADKSFLKLRGDLRYQLFEKHYLSFTANFAKVDQNVFFNLDDLLEDRKTGYAVGYGFNSFIGPVELKYSWSPDHEDGHFLFNLGFWF